MITKHDFQNEDAQRGIQTSTKGTFGKHVLRFPDAFAFAFFNSFFFFTRFGANFTVMATVHTLCMNISRKV